MAIFNNPNQQQQQNPNAAPTIGQPQQVNAVAKATSSGRFNNLNAYLNANKGFNQAQGGLAGKVVGSVENKAQNVSNQVGQAQTQFQGQAEAARVKQDPNMYQQLQQDPNAIAQDPSKIAAFERIRDAQYAGPQDLANAPQLQNEAGKIQSYANLGQSDAGRQTLLQKLYNTPQYSRGQQGLDNLLLQGNQQQLQKLNTLQGLAGNLSSSVTGASDAAKAAAKDYSDEAAATQAATRSALGSTLGTYDSAAELAASNAQGEYKKQYDDLFEKFQSGTISQPDLQGLGLGSQMELYGASPLEALMAGSAQATKQNAISSQQQSQFDALNKLAGNTLSPEQSQMLAQYAGNSQAGTFAQNPAYTFDKSKFLGDIASKKSAYEGERNAAQQTLGEAQHRITKGDNGEMPLQQMAATLSAMKLVSPQLANEFAQKSGYENADAFQSVYQAEIGKQSNAQAQLEQLLKQYKIGQGFGTPLTVAGISGPVSGPK